MIFDDAYRFFEFLIFFSSFPDHFKLYLYKDRDEYLRLSKQIDGTHPAPFEDVLGYETGYCVDRDHHNCILMIGRRSVFFISYPDFKQMITWGQRLGNVLKCKCSFVCLCSLELHACTWKVCYSSPSNYFNVIMSFYLCLSVCRPLFSCHFRISRRQPQFFQTARFSSCPTFPTLFYSRVGQQHVEIQLCMGK